MHFAVIVLLALATILVLATTEVMARSTPPLHTTHKTMHDRTQAVVSVAAGDPINLSVGSLFDTAGAATVIVPADRGSAASAWITGDGPLTLKTRSAGDKTLALSGLTHVRYSWDDDSWMYSSVAESAV